MLGWEYPPRFAGGLGKACQGLAQGLAKQGAQVFFVLPTFPERVTEQRLEVIGAMEALMESGWDPAVEPWGPGTAAAGAPHLSPSPLLASGVSVILSEARLLPYGKPAEEEQAPPWSRNVGGGTPGIKTGGTRANAKGAPQAARPFGRKVDLKTVSVREVSREIYGKNLWQEIERFCITVRHLAETHEVDVVHAHDWMTFPAAFEFSRMTGAPVFLHVHATEYDRSGENVNNEIFRIERDGFRSAAHIFAVSRYTAGIIERLYGVHRKKISVVHNAPEEDARHLLESPLSPRKPQVVFLGRLTFQKGPDHFLRAAALAAQADAEARFVFCGTGDMMDKLRSMAHRLGIEGRVHFAGFVEPAQVDDILRESRVLVMPSVSEPFGLVALEAIHCGIPVIISKQSGVREVLPRALQVDFWDHEKLADQILAALRLPELSRQLVEEGMTSIQRLSWDDSARKAMDAYRNHLGRTFAQAIEGRHGR
jgi:glycogen synthase